jgi:hypothetical protein
LHADIYTVFPKLSNILSPHCTSTLLLMANRAPTPEWRRKNGNQGNNTFRRPQAIPPPPPPRQSAPPRQAIALNRPQPPLSPPGRWEGSSDSNGAGSGWDAEDTARKEKLRQDHAAQHWSECHETPVCKRHRSQKCLELVWNWLEALPEDVDAPRRDVVEAPKEAPTEAPRRGWRRDG